MTPDHIPLLIPIAEREGDPHAAAEAFFLVLLLSRYGHDHMEEAARMVWRLNPCASRARGGLDKFGFQRRTEAEPPTRDGLPMIFADLAEHCFSCGACAGSADMAGIRSLLGAWARTIKPCEDDFPLVMKLATESAGYLRLWATNNLSRYLDRLSKAVEALWLKANPESEIERAVALHALAGSGEEGALDALAEAAGGGDEFALALLGDVARRREFDEAARAFLDASGDPESVVYLSMLMPMLFGARMPEEYLESLGLMLIERPANSPTLLGYHSLMTGGMAEEAAARSLDALWKAPWTGAEAEDEALLNLVFPYLEAWIPAEFRSFLESRAQSGDEAGRAAAALLIGRLDGPLVFKAAGSRGGNVAELRRRLGDRSSGQYWSALADLAIMGEPEAQDLYTAALANGYYGVWSEDEGVFLGTRMDSTEFILWAAETNCCSLVFVKSAFSIRFGSKFEDLAEAVPTAADVFTPAELMRIWWDRVGQTARFSKIAGHYVTGR